MASLVERLGDVRRSFRHALDLGCHTGQLGEALYASGFAGELVQADLAQEMARHADGLRVVADEEALPFAGGTFDLVLSAFSLHWANDLPGVLVQLRDALEPDGLFLAALPGTGTLGELRDALMVAEMETQGGAALRVSPFLDVRDAGMLLQRAGFALPVVDLEPVTVTYDHPLKLMAELRGMGESSAVTDRAGPLARTTLARALELYQERYGDGRGRVPATFNIVVMTAWKPDPRQQTPLRPGSGRVSLARALQMPSDGHARPTDER